MYLFSGNIARALSMSNVFLRIGNVVSKTMLAIHTIRCGEKNIAIMDGATYLGKEYVSLLHSTSDNAIAEETHIRIHAGTK